MPACVKPCQISQPDHPQIDGMGDNDRPDKQMTACPARVRNEKCLAHLDGEQGQVLPSSVSFSSAGTGRLLQRAGRAWRGALIPCSGRRRANPAFLPGPTRSCHPFPAGRALLASAAVHPPPPAVDAHPRELNPHTTHTSPGTSQSHQPSIRVCIPAA